MSQQLMQLNDHMTDWLRDERLRIGERVTFAEVMAEFRLPPAMRGGSSGLLGVWVECGFLRRCGAQDQFTQPGYDAL